jgi:hypothetical protein
MEAVATEAYSASRLSLRKAAFSSSLIQASSFAS